MPPQDDPRNPWFSWEYVRTNADSLVAALEQHVTLTVVAVAIAAALGLPLAVAAARVRWLGAPILAVSGVLYTVPSLALFALLGPTLGGSSETVVIGLVIYALIAVVR